MNTTTNYEINPMTEITIDTINMNTLSNPLNLLVLEFYKPDFTNFLRQHFSKEAIEEVISKHRIGDVVTWEYISVDQSSCWFKKGYPCESKVYSHDFDVYMTYKGKEWSSKETKPAYKFYVPQKYTFYMADIIKELIYLAYPWMKEFKFDCYSWEYGTKNYEFYLKCDNGKFMYVPMSTMTEHNPQIAEERTVSYYNEYYRWPGGWGKDVTEDDVMRWRKENTVDLVESKTWKKFCEHLTKENIIETEYISTWSGGSEIHTQCKVNLNTKEVIEAEFDVDDAPWVDDEVCVNEWVKIGDEMIPVYPKNVYEGKGFWYEF